MDQESSGVIGTTSRRGLVQRAVVFGAATLAGGVWSSYDTDEAAPAPSEALDHKIFNFALLLEYMQAAFYTEAVDRGALRGEAREFAETVGEHERAHVAYLRDFLGGGARARPQFRFRGATSSMPAFLKTALELENIGVAAYNGQAANLTKPALVSAMEIVSVEGRHAAWISDLAGRNPAPRAADPGESAAMVAAALRATRFIKQ
jgi:ferritin-like protein